MPEIQLIIETNTDLLIARKNVEKENKNNKMMLIVLNRVKKKNLSRAQWQQKILKYHYITIIAS